MNSRMLACAAVGVLLTASPATAQDHGSWPQRTFITVDVPFQPLNNEFSESLSFPDSFKKTENITFAAGYESTRGALFDAGAGVRLMKRVGAGLTVSWMRLSGSASFDLQVPNPLVANKPLELPGSVSGLNRNEVGVHLQALYALALGSKAHVMLAAGPSVFNVRQDVVRSIEFETLPGFTSLKLDEPLITEVEKTAVGFNVSADVTWSLTRHFGIGSVTRYARANVRLEPGSESGVDRAIEMRAGGLQIGGGVRLMF